MPLSDRRTLKALPPWGDGGGVGDELTPTQRRELFICGIFAVCLGLLVVAYSEWSTRSDNATPETGPRWRSSGTGRERFEDMPLREVKP
jgi:hypothetical protein